MTVPSFRSFNSTETPFLPQNISPTMKVLLDARTGAPTGLQSANANGPNGIWAPVDLTAAQIAAPTAAMIADLNAVYRLNVAPYTRYYSNGTDLDTFGLSSIGDISIFDSAGELVGSISSYAIPGLAILEERANNISYHDNVRIVYNDSYLYWQQNVTGTFTSGSPNVTGVSALTGALVLNFLQEQTNPATGELVVPVGTTFPAGTRIASNLTANSFTMSANALVTGSRTFSVLAQAGNAADVYAGPANGVLGDGQTFFAVGMSAPGNSTQGFRNLTRTGATLASFTGTISGTALTVSGVTGTIAAGQTIAGVGVTTGTTIVSGAGASWVVSASQTVGPVAMTAAHIIGVGAAYLEASSLGPAGNLQYLDITLTLTHNANSDYYPSESWDAIRINGQTGDFAYRDHLDDNILSIIEATRLATLDGFQVIHQHANNDNLLYFQSYDNQFLGAFSAQNASFKWLFGKGATNYLLLDGFYASSLKPANYATYGGLEIGGTVVTNPQPGYGLKITTPSANGSIGVVGPIVMLTDGYFCDSVGDALTAVGTNRATALLLAAAYNRVTSAASGTGVTLAESVTKVKIGGSLIVDNSGANPIKVYAQGSETIDGTSGAVGVTLTNALRCIYKLAATNTWISYQLGAISA